MRPQRRCEVHHRSEREDGRLAGRVLDRGPEQADGVRLGSARRARERQAEQAVGRAPPILGHRVEPFLRKLGATRHRHIAVTCDRQEIENDPRTTRAMDEPGARDGHGA